MQNGGTDAIGADVSRVDPSVPGEDVRQVRNDIYHNILRMIYISYIKLFNTKLVDNILRATVLLEYFISIQNNHELIKLMREALIQMVTGLIILSS